MMHKWSLGTLILVVSAFFLLGAASNLATAQTWSKCSNGLSRCKFKGTKTVRFGVSLTSKFIDVVKTNGVWCDAGPWFPTDPAPGERKSCWTSAVAPAPVPAPAPAPEPTPDPSQVTWTRCAAEGVAYPGDTCTFSGTRQVRYGVPGAYTYKVATSSIVCSDGAFGVTVATPYQNFCDYSSETTTALNPEPTPAPTPAPEPTPEPAPVPTPTGSAGPRVSSFSSSGPITATSGQVISGLRISNPNGACVTISGVTGVVLKDNEIGPCGGPAVNIINGASGNTVEYNRVSADIERGIIVVGAAGNTVQKNVLLGVRRIGDNKHAIEVTRSDRTNVIGNYFTGAWESDILSGYESSDCRFLDNEFVGVSIDKPSGAAFTIGDSTTNNPGRNNYVARNKVYSQTGGVPAGVFGSSGNTILEYNCFAAGIQAYNYSGVFVGVTVRNNVINMSNSFVPDTSIISGWSTNINSTNCSLVPQ